MFLFTIQLSKDFYHEHPVFNGERWDLEFNLPKNGKYFMWAQGEITKDQEEFKSMTRILIVDGEPANPGRPDLKETRTAADGISKVTLSSERIQPKKMVMLDLQFTLAPMVRSHN